MAVFNDEAYKLAQVAAQLMPPDPEHTEPSWDEVADWAFELVAACQKALGNEGE